MVYNQKFVVAIKVNGKILRENSGDIFIPFGSEYSIMLKNLNSVKAVASIHVDGEDVLDNHEVIVPANTSVEIEGFSKNKKVTNKFKFIKKTEQITNYRGNKIDDGLVRVSFKFEEGSTASIWWHHTPIQTYVSHQTYTPNCWADSSTPLGSSSCVFAANCDTQNTDGITVKGSTSSQQFSNGFVGNLETTENVIVLKLVGYIKSTPIKEAVLVKTKITCDTCGKKSKTSNKFCSNCGTALF
jgi:hypothetical protein